MKKRPRLRCLELILLGVFILSFLLLLIGGAGYYLLPRLAEDAFGPANPAMGEAQRITASVELLLHREDLNRPLDQEGQPRTFIVRLGETANSVAVRLEESGLVWNGAVFRTYLVYTGLDTTIQAGEYTLSPAMTPREIALELQDATPEEVEFNILPGWRAEEIAAALPTSGLSIRPEAFLQVVRKPPDSILPEDWPSGTSLEGALLPGPYRLMRNLTADMLVRTFTRAFDQAVTDDLRSAFASRNLSLQEAVTLASIVQREALVVEEQPLIASVFLNRLADGMKLDSDPTVQYALGFNPAQNTWWTNPLSASDLRINSPYNTYLNQGLPPGPICNPSIEALRAVAYPAQTPYYYFRAACDGSGRHTFARSYEEHLQNACP